MVAVPCALQIKGQNHTHSHKKGRKGQNFVRRSFLSLHMKTKSLFHSQRFHHSYKWAEDFWVTRPHSTYVKLDEPCQNKILQALNAESDKLAFLRHRTFGFSVNDILHLKYTLKRTINFKINTFLRRLKED